jgi:hypothetical protein
LSRDCGRAQLISGMCCGSTSLYTLAMALVCIYVILNQLLIGRFPRPLKKDRD